MLELQPDNQQVKFYVGSLMERRGNLGQARKLIEKLAPEDSVGFAPAHAWMAAFLLRNPPDGTSKETKSQADEYVPRLRHHLDIACRWTNVAPGLLVVYSGMLEQDGKRKEALALAKRAASLDPAYSLAVAELAARQSSDADRREAATRSSEYFRDRVSKPNATVNDRLALAQALIYEEKFSDALEALKGDLSKSDAPPQVRRLASEAFRLQFLTSFKQESVRSGKSEPS